MSINNELINQSSWRFLFLRPSVEIDGVTKLTSLLCLRSAFISVSDSSMAFVAWAFAVFEVILG